MRPQTATARIEDLLVHADWLHRLAVHLVHDNDADDLVQETWATAAGASLRTDWPTQPWLGTVMRNLARRRWRSAQVQDRNRPAVLATATPTPSPAELLERAQMQRALATAVTELDEPFRSTILLRYYEGRSAADIARELGLPAGTVRWRLSSAMERLRRRLQDGNGESRRSWVILVSPLGRPVTTAMSAGTTTSVARGASFLGLGTPGKIRTGRLTTVTARRWCHVAALASRDFHG